MREGLKLLAELGKSLMRIKLVGTDFMEVHQLAPRGIQPFDDNFRNTFHQFVTKIMVLIAQLTEAGAV